MRGKFFTFKAYKMPDFKKRYTLPEKLAIIRESLEGESTVREVAMRYGIHEATISRWRKTYGSDVSEDIPEQIKESNKTSPDMNADQKRIRQLEKELLESRIETEILKKAIRIFSKTDGNITSL